MGFDRILFQSEDFQRVEKINSRGLLRRQASKTERLPPIEGLNLIFGV
jgi:hypothetical protein